MTEIRPADRRDIPILIELLAAQLSEHGLAAGREQVYRGIEVAFEAGAPLLVAREGARALLSRLLADGRASGVRAVELQVDEGHEPARALYRGLGFEPNARTPWVLDLSR